MFSFLFFEHCNSLSQYFTINTSLTTINMTVMFDRHSNNTAITKAVANNKEKVIIPALLRCNGVVYKTRILGPRSFAGIVTKEVVFPKSLSVIDQEAFSGSFIETLTLPDSLALIEKYAFCNCSLLKAANLSEVYLDELPEGCFMNCYNLASILLPKADVIGNYSLKSTKIGNDIRIPMSTLVIAERAFFNCTFITELDLRYSAITTIESFAFANCSNLSVFRLPFSTKTIYSNIIENTNITTICIPEGVEELSKNSFLNNKLCSIQSQSQSFIVINSTLYYSKNEEKDRLQLLFVPPSLSKYAYRVSQQTDEIMRFAFAYSQIEKIAIPLSVRVIHKFAFYCSKISSITFTKSHKTYSIDSIEEGAFYGCSQLKEAQFSLIGITEIPPRCFYKCTSLSVFTFPSRTTFIGSEALSYTAVSSLSIPIYTSAIVPGAFSHCSQLRNINIAKGNIAYEVYKNILYDLHNNTLLCFPAGINRKHCSVRAKTLCIAAYAFTDANIDTVAFNKEMIRIGSYAFQGSSIKNIVLPESVRFIGRGAFTNCTQMTDADMDNATVTSMTEFAFDGCTSLRSVLLPYALKQFKPMCFRGCNSIELVYYDGTTNIGGTDVFPPTAKVYVTDSYPPNRFLGLKVKRDNKIQ